MNMCDICDLTVTYDSILLKELLHDYLLTLVWSLKKKKVQFSGSP